MKRKLWAAALSMLFSALIPTAQANILTITVQGTISNGSDSAGIFGPAFRNLSGLSYTERISTNIDPAQWSAGYAFGSTCGFSQPGFTDVVTVNGQAFTVAVPTSTFRCVELQDGVSIHDPFSPIDDIFSSMDGYTGTGVFALADIDIYSQSIPFVPSVALNQSFTVPVAGLSGVRPVGGLSGVVPVGGLSGVLPVGGLSAISLFAYGATNFSGDVTSITVDGTVVEPASIATLGLGLAGLAAIRRRSSKK